MDGLVSGGVAFVLRQGATDFDRGIGTIRKIGMQR